MKTLSKAEVSKVRVAVNGKGYTRLIAALGVGEGLLVRKREAGTYFQVNVRQYAKESNYKVSVRTTTDGKSWLVTRVA